MQVLVVDRRVFHLRPMRLLHRRHAANAFSRHASSHSGSLLARRDQADGVLGQPLGRQVHLDVGREAPFVADSRVTAWTVSRVSAACRHSNFPIRRQRGLRRGRLPAGAKRRRNRGRAHIGERDRGQAPRGSRHSPDPSGPSRRTCPARRRHAGAARRRRSARSAHRPRRSRRRPKSPRAAAPAGSRRARRAARRPGRRWSSAFSTLATVGSGTPVAAAMPGDVCTASSAPARASARSPSARRISTTTA